MIDVSEIFDLNYGAATLTLRRSSVSCCTISMSLVVFVNVSVLRFHENFHLNYRVSWYIIDHFFIWQQIFLLFCSTHVGMIFQDCIPIVYHDCIQFLYKITWPYRVLSINVNRSEVWWVAISFESLIKVPVSNVGRDGGGGGATAIGLIEYYSTAIHETAKSPSPLSRHCARCYIGENTDPEYTSAPLDIIGSSKYRVNIVSIPRPHSRIGFSNLRLQSSFSPRIINKRRRSDFFCSVAAAPTAPPYTAFGNSLEWPDINLWRVYRPRVIQRE